MQIHIITFLFLARKNEFDDLKDNRPYVAKSLDDYVVLSEASPVIVSITVGVRCDVGRTTQRVSFGS